ncbi:MAG TPA: hypothetical protein PLJ27_27065 [Polyangiaceae bacterium]|nr:MAG: hypothetical protein BWY17_01905 [Deltaproteobacteria bacterium ADurb.Bin207]HNS98144.1 hypothetical protein [Polyangiaceae bacterium]HNZ22278.1 hypothetical protein [Polyangiaceae bacterium]HOD25014.1 hypothetical protein [Polyangiaceae bacterium]HOE51537.1 hypothetical protein [Polyangiaceae bacterium]
MTGRRRQSIQPIGASELVDAEVHGPSGAFRIFRWFESDRLTKGEPADCSFSISNKFKALRRSWLEIPADGGAVWVDGAIVGGSRHAEVNTGAVGADGESPLSKMTFGQRFDQVVQALAPPLVDIVLCDQDGSWALMATGAATKAGMFLQTRIMA